MVRLGAGNHPDRAIRVAQRCGDEGVLRIAGEGRAGQQPTRHDGDAQPGAGIAGAAAEHGRGEQAAAHRQIADAPGAELQRVARLQHHRGPGRERPDVAPGPGDAPSELTRQRHADRPTGGAQRGGGEQHLQPGRLRPIAGQVVGGGQQQRVEGAGERHADAAVAGAAGVLHRHAEAGGEDVEAGAHGRACTASAASARLATARKHTRSPGASRAGRAALPASKSATPVRPSSRQPPGLSHG